MAITYTVGGGLYVNLTNKCSNDCAFCVRRGYDSVGGVDSLWLEREPTREEVWAELEARAPFSEVVFCGFGEPTERLDDLLWIAGRLKAAGAFVRVNTNGHASMIAGYDTSPRFEGLVDCLSISLNASAAEDYERVCKPVFGRRAFEGLLDFARKAARYVPEVVLSVVEGTTDIAACRALADSLGLPLRVRAMID